MTSTLDIVVSAENLDGHAWQSMLFHHSCRTRTGHTPIVVVHGDEDELAEGFKMIEADGGRVQRRANFRHRGRLIYPPRNQMRTAQLVATDASHLVLCDPDMIFLAPVDFGAVADALASQQVSMDRISHLQVNDDNREFLRRVCDRGGIDLAALEAVAMNGAPPHVIPRRLRQRLCHEWDIQLERCLEASWEVRGGADEHGWVSSMWGLVLALHSLRYSALLTDLCVHTFGDPALSVDQASTGGPPFPMLHYSYATEAFDKRDWEHGDAWRRVWAATATSGTASGEVCAQLAEAARHFDI